MEGLGIVEPAECDGTLPIRCPGDAIQDLVTRGQRAFDYASSGRTAHNYLLSEGRNDALRPYTVLPELRKWCERLEVFYDWEARVEEPIGVACHDEPVMEVVRFDLRRSSARAPAKSCSTNDSVLTLPPAKKNEGCARAH
jgi:hypothetical protein